jgi:hypothetical protein
MSNTQMPASHNLATAFFFLISLGYGQQGDQKRIIACLPLCVASCWIRHIFHLSHVIRTARSLFGTIQTDRQQSESEKKVKQNKSVIFKMESREKRIKERSLPWILSASAN